MGNKDCVRCPPCGSTFSTLSRIKDHLHFVSHFRFSDSLFINSRLSNVSLWLLFRLLSQLCLLSTVFSLCVFWFLFLLFSFQFNSFFEVCFTRCFWLCLVQLVGFLFASTSRFLTKC